MTEALLVFMGAIGFGLILGSIVADVIHQRAER